MASSATVKAAQGPTTTQRLWKVVPSLAIFGTFTASALSMKIAPLYGLLPGETNKEILKAWSKFAALPELQMVLKPLSLNVQTFMVAVAVAHLIIAVILVLPSGPWGTRIAGLWAMVAMAGAEFCTRKTAFIPAGFPKEYQWLGVMITTATHALLFLFGFLMVFSEYRGGLIVMLNELMASAKKTSPAKTEEQRGRPISPQKTNSKRDSTPKVAMKKAGDSPSKSASPPSRGGKK